jgi:hypothetical protein
MTKEEKSFGGNRSYLEFGHWSLGFDWDLAPWSLVISAA